MDGLERKFGTISLEMIWQYLVKLKIRPETQQFYSWVHNGEKSSWSAVPGDIKNDTVVWFTTRSRDYQLSTKICSHLAEFQDYRTSGQAMFPSRLTPCPVVKGQPTSFPAVDREESDMCHIQARLLRQCMYLYVFFPLPWLDADNRVSLGGGRAQNGKQVIPWIPPEGLIANQVHLSDTTKGKKRTVIRGIIYSWVSLLAYSNTNLNVHQEKGQVVIESSSGLLYSL